MSRSKLDRLTDAQLRDVALKLVQRDPTAGWAPVMQELMLRMGAPTIDADTLRTNLARLRDLNGEAIRITARLHDLTTSKEGTKHG